MVFQLDNYVAGVTVVKGRDPAVDLAVDFIGRLREKNKALRAPRE